MDGCNREDKPSRTILYLTGFNIDREDDVGFKYALE